MRVRLAPPQVKLRRLDSRGGGAAPLGGRSGVWEGGSVPPAISGPAAAGAPRDVGAGCHVPAGPWALPGSRCRCGAQQDGDPPASGCWPCPGEEPRRWKGAGHRGPKVPGDQPRSAAPARLMICPADELGGAQGLGGTLSRPLARGMGLHPCTPRPGPRWPKRGKSVKLVSGKRPLSVPWHGGEDLDAPWPWGTGSGAQEAARAGGCVQIQLLKFPVRAKYPSKTCRESQFLQQDRVGWFKIPPPLACAAPAERELPGESFKKK